MKFGYADPPYFGCGKLYAEHHPDALDWDEPATHARLVERLQDEFDGWVLHASATPESQALYAPLLLKTGARHCVWVKGFAAFKRNVPVAYAWEPVFIKAGRKPEAVCHWAFEIAAARPEDVLSDLFPGTEAVSRAWRTWQGKFTLPFQLEAAE